MKVLLHSPQPITQLFHCDVTLFIKRPSKKNQLKSGLVIITLLLFQLVFSKVS